MSFIFIYAPNLFPMLSHIIYFIIYNHPIPIFYYLSSYAPNQGTYGPTFFTHRNICLYYTLIDTLLFNLSIFNLLIHSFPHFHISIITHVPNSRFTPRIFRTYLKYLLLLLHEYNVLHYSHLFLGSPITSFDWALLSTSSYMHVPILMFQSSQQTMIDD